MLRRHIVMVALLRSPRRVVVASFLAISLFLILALRHHDYLNLTGQQSQPQPKPQSQSQSQPAHAPVPDSASVYIENEGSREGGVELKEEQDHELKQEDHQQQQEQDHELELVVASTKKEDTSWLHTFLPAWHKNIYVADDTTAPLTVPKNKGREAMVYLTYMIDRYDTLPRNVLFLHASRFAWHNDDPDYDALPTLRNFRLPYLQQSGYVNLRCVWVIGCPSEIRPAHDEAHRDDAKLMAKNVYKKSFEELLPEVPVPDLVAVSCCSQFGVTRETIRSRPRADYIRYREWLLATPLDDALNGRVFEFAWHIIFGKEAVHCPSAADCYCNVFGLCNMTCKGDSCTGRYTLPPYSTLPKGWPLVGWDTEERNFTGPL
ncbi:hypothetical protein HD806DRAFT_515294 [Xylariaceae sp. AK1471]|nr:hypothetical protein HD806DRAFT_515294 [Xylariaceae sp. AK1471]